MMQCSLGFVTKIWNVKKNCNAVLSEFWIEVELSMSCRLSCEWQLHQRLFHVHNIYFHFHFDKVQCQFSKRQRQTQATGAPPSFLGHFKYFFTKLSFLQDGKCSVLSCCHNECLLKNWAKDKDKHQEWLGAIFFWSQWMFVEERQRKGLCVWNDFLMQMPPKAINVIPHLSPRPPPLYSTFGGKFFMFMSWTCQQNIIQCPL